MNEDSKPDHFLKTQIKSDLESGKTQQLVTRFPPEPNGYLHIGHAKSICINFGLAETFSGVCNLRFDDTNPEKESDEFVESIKADIRWLGFQWHGEVHFSSDYFEQLYVWAQALIKSGDAYVCHQTVDQARESRGTLTEPGENSPYRDRSVAENLALFEQMRAGEFDEGNCSLRAKIDMSSPNMNLRDPVMYRIRKVHHHHTGDKWCIYPTYDFTHGQSDAIEGISHSICTLEFEDHRPLYEWYLARLPVTSKPRQYEFSRLNLNYTVTSKRKLRQLVEEGYVSGWDDPRMPTLTGMRRRGIPPQAIREFCERIGVTRSDGVVDVGMLEFCIRDYLDKQAPRAMCVLEPLKITITNYPDGKTEILKAPGHPNRDDLAERQLPFGPQLYIEADDFREAANKKYKRLVLEKEVRLRNGYVIKANEVIKDEQGKPIEVLCTYDPETLGKNPADGRKVKGVIHWVSADSNLTCDIQLYDRLFTDPEPDAGNNDFLQLINPESQQRLVGCKAEIGLKDAVAGKAFQFERTGYFCRDSVESASDRVVFNRTISLRDSWAG